MHGAALLVSNPGWAQDLVAELLPGAHVVLFTEDETDAVAGRLAGLHLRDTLLVLRPMASGFAFLFRVPMVGTVIENARQRGAGPLNVDACRIRWKSEAERLAAMPGSMPKANDSVGTFQTRDRTAERPEDFQNPLGRWPSNVLIVHGPGCTLTGERRIEGHKGYPNGPGGSSSQFSQKGTKTTRTGAWAGHADAEGMETVPEWACEPGCLARRLDVLSGVLTSGRLDRAGIVAENKTYGAAPKKRVGIYEADAGGASRFYPQFRDESELIAWVRQLVAVPDAPTLERGL